METEEEELDFTEAQNNRIDEVENACYAVAEAAIERKKCLIGFMQNLCTLVRVMTERYDDVDLLTDIDSQGILSYIAHMVITEVEEYLENHVEELPDHTKYFKWDMEYIGEIADSVAAYLVWNGYPVRYPYMAEDENGNMAVYDYITVDF